MSLSVVVAGVSGERAISGCLESIRRAAGDLEMVVLRGDARAVFQLRARGIAQAAGERIAVVGDRYQVTPEWAAALRSAAGFDITGGPVAPGALNYWGWCVYLCEYLHLAPPVETGPTHQPKSVAGGNVIYRTSALEKLQAMNGESDLAFHSRLMEAGLQAGIQRDLEVRFHCPPGVFEYASERFAYSRSIGREGGPLKLLLAPLLPFLVLLRSCSWVAKKPRYTGHFLICVPVVFLFGVLQAVGESAGALSKRAR